MWIPVRRLIGRDVPGVGGEARAADHVDLGGLRHRRLERGDLAGVVLAVAVDLDHVLVVVLAGVGEARLDRAADPEVERQRDHPGARPARRDVAVASVEPSSMTTTSKSGASRCSARTTLATVSGLVVRRHDGQAPGVQ